MAEATAQLVRPEAKPTTGLVAVPTTTDQLHKGVVAAIAQSSTEAGHPVTPVQATPQGEANQVLANIEQAGIGAQVIDTSQDLLGKAIHNARSHVDGTKLVYTAKGVTGQDIVHEKASRKAIFTGLSQTISNALSRFRKK
jgi:hypothetical protein